MGWGKALHDLSVFGAIGKVLGVLHFAWLEPIGILDVLFRSESQEDGLVVLFRLILVCDETLLAGLFLLLLRMLLHIDEEGFRGAFNLGRIKLVWGAILHPGCYWGICGGLCFDQSGLWLRFAL